MGSIAPVMAQAPSRPTSHLQAPPDSQIENWERERAQRPAAQLDVLSPRPAREAITPTHTPAEPLFRLAKVSVTGATALGLDEIASHYLPFLGQNVSQADLSTIADAITRQYRQAGYHLSRAIIPAQELKGGHLLIQVIEGVIEDIVLKGDDADTFGLKALLAPVGAERPSLLGTLERQLLQAGDRAGVQIADTALEEIGTASGRFRLIVKSKTWRGFVAAGVDNSGTKANGPWQASFGVALNSLLVAGDSLSLAGTTTPGSLREMKFGRIAYDLPIGTSGIRAGLSASHSEIRPGDERRQIRTLSQSETYEARLSAMPILTQKQALGVSASFGISDIVEETAYGPNFKDSIWLGTLSADYRFRASENSWTFANASVRQGFGIVNPLPDSRDGTSRVVASPHFTVYNLSITHIQNLIENWSLKLAAAGQHATGPLLNAQQFYLGGSSFGRGFDAGWISGDRAIAGSAELRFDQPLKLAFTKGYQLFGFVEGGVVSTTYRPKNQVQSLASAGVGIRVSLTDEVQLGLSLAKPVAYHAPLQHKKGVTVLFSLTSAMRLCPSQGTWRCS